MMLGILISVVATILAPTIGNNVKEQFNEFIKKTYRSDSIMLNGGTGFMGGGAGWNKLKVEDAEIISKSIGGIQMWDPVLRGDMSEVQGPGDSVEVLLMGHSERGNEIQNRDVVEGSFFTADDVRRRAHVVLLGIKTTEKLFNGEDPIGEQVYINNVPYLVKGVLESAGMDPHGNDRDDVIFVPYTTLQEHIMKIDFINGVVFIIDDVENEKNIVDEMYSIMREQHNIIDGQNDDFSTVTPVLMFDLVNRSYKVFDVFIPIISGIAFLISTLLIMKIMLISVKQRTPEIGLRKALGAKPSDIKIQLFMEILITSVAGMILGYLISLGILNLVQPIFEEKFGVSELSIPHSVLLVSIALTLFATILGGLLPASRAGKLDPIIALK